MWVNGIVGRGCSGYPARIIAPVMIVYPTDDDDDDDDALTFHISSFPEI